MEILEQALNKIESAETLRRTANNATRALAKPSVQEDRARIQGAEITREQAETIFSQARHRAEGHRLDGLYRVIRIDTESDTGFAIRVEHIETGQEFLAEANFGELPQEDIHIIFQAAEDKAYFDGLVNITCRGDHIERGAIMRADEVEEEPEVIED